MDDGSATRSEAARIAQAERVAGAINVVKWIVVLVIALATVVVALLLGFGALDSEEAARATPTVDSYLSEGDGGPSQDYVEPEPSEPEGPGAATRFLQALLVLVGGGLQALLVWIAFGWAQHTLGMLTILARRRAP